jgi:cholest-4-en-3-one 26-monooxygenase
VLQRAIGLRLPPSADALPGIRLAGDPRRLRSAWINGVKELPVAYG